MIESVLNQSVYSVHRSNLCKAIAIETNYITEYRVSLVFLIRLQFDRDKNYKREAKKKKKTVYCHIEMFINSPKQTKTNRWIDHIHACLFNN